MGALALAAAVSLAGNLVAIPRWGAIGLAGVAVAANFSVTLVFGFGLRRELAGAALLGLAIRTAGAAGVMAVAAWWARSSMSTGSAMSSRTSVVRTSPVTRFVWARFAVFSLNTQRLLL